jgi:acylphosphatase
LQQRDVKIDIYWNGDDSDITRLTEHLEEIDDWKVKKINYKDNNKEKQEK